MCFTSGPTSDPRRSSLTDGLRAKLLQISGPKPNKSKLPVSRKSSAHASVKSPQTVAKIVAVRNQENRSRTPVTRRLGSSAQMTAMQNTGAMTTSVSGKGVESERFAGDSESCPKQDKKVFAAAQIVSKMKTKQMKGLITGMGKELRRAATTVGEKLPSPKKKQNREEKERQELLGAEPQKPQVRNPDEIKKAYGHAGDPRQAASITHDKLRERGEKLSAIQRRTTELEGDAANFSSLTQELVKKIESKKWYEI